MALQVSLAYETGDIYPVAYARISEVRLLIDQRRVSIRVLVYRDKAAREVNRREVVELKYLSNHTDYERLFSAGADVVRAAYLWLREQESYAQATDV